MTRRIIPYAFQVAQLIEPAARRLAALLQHRAEVVAGLHQFIISRTNRIFSEYRRRGLTEGAGFRVDGNRLNRVAIV